MIVLHPFLFALRDTFRKTRHRLSHLIRDHNPGPDPITPPLNESKGIPDDHVFQFVLKNQPVNYSGKD